MGALALALLVGGAAAAQSYDRQRDQPNRSHQGYAQSGTYSQGQDHRYGQQRYYGRDRGQMERRDNGYHRHWGHQSCYWHDHQRVCR